MLVGVPRETKAEEYRVALTPGSVAELTARGHDVLVETGAGRGSSIGDAEYVAAGGRIVSSAADAFSAELVVKVKEPQGDEVSLLRPGQVLFAYLHLAPDRELTQALVASGATCIAYETVEHDDGSLPLLAPMSEIAGRMASQAGAEHLQKPKGGRGVLMGGVPGVLPAKVAVIGGGVVGSNAARVAAGLGARVTVADVDLARLSHIDEVWSGTVRTVFSNRYNIEELVLASDLVIGAVLVAGARAPTVVTREHVAAMKSGAVVVDVAVDQGGCVETSRPTTHSEPTFVVDDVVHYCVANMPGAVPSTSTNALTHATTAYVLSIADEGWRDAVRRDPSLARGVNVADGSLTSAPVAEAHDLPLVSLDDLLA